MPDKQGINININLNVKNRCSAKKISNHDVAIRTNPRNSQPNLPISPPGVYKIIDDPRKTDQVLDDLRLKSDRKSFNKTTDSRAVTTSKKKFKKLDVQSSQLKRLSMLAELKDQSAKKSRIKSSIFPGYIQNRYQDSSRRLLSRLLTKQLRSSSHSKTKRNSISCQKRKSFSAQKLRTRSIQKKRINKQKATISSKKSVQQLDKQLKNRKQLKKDSPPKRKSPTKKKEFDEGFNKKKNKGKRKKSKKKLISNKFQILKDLKQNEIQGDDSIHLKPKNLSDKCFKSKQHMTVWSQLLQKYFKTFLIHHQYKLKQTAAIKVQSIYRMITAKRKTLTLVQQLQNQKASAISEFKKNQDNSYWGSNDQSIRQQQNISKLQQFLQQEQQKQNQLNLKNHSLQHQLAHSQQISLFNQENYYMQQDTQYQQQISKLLLDIKDVKPDLQQRLAKFLDTSKQLASQNKRIMMENIHLKDNVKQLAIESRQRQNSQVKGSGTDSFIRQILQYKTDKSKIKSGSTPPLQQVKMDISQQVSQRQIQSQHQLFELIRQRQKIIHQRFQKQKAIIIKLYDITRQPSHQKEQALDQWFKRQCRRIQLSKKHIQKGRGLLQDSKRKLDKDIAILMEIDKLQQQGRYSQLQKLINQSAFVLSQSGRSLGKSQTQFSQDQLKKSSNVQQKRYLQDFNQDQRITDNIIPNNRIAIDHTASDSSLPKHNQHKSNILMIEQDQSQSHNQQEVNILNLQSLPYQVDNKNQQYLDQQGNPQIDTSLAFVRRYIYAFLQYSVRQNYMQIKTKLMQPGGVPTYLVLGSFNKNKNEEYRRLSEQNSEDQFYQAIFRTHKRDQIISTQILNQFNQVYDSLKINQHGSSQLTILLQEMHIQMLLDCLNQAFQFQRSFSWIGPPMPWQSTHISGINLQFRQWQDVQGLARTVGNKIMQWASVLCGFYPQIKEQQTGQIIVIDKQQQLYIKETRLTLLLQKVVVENQFFWTDYSLQKTAFKILTGQWIMDRLINQVVQQFGLVDQ